MTDPSGRAWALGDAATCRALSADLARLVTVRSHDRPQHYASGTVLVTVERSRRELERDLGQPVDLRRFRPNLHLDLDADAFAEVAWTGGVLRVGEAELELLQPCDRCVIAARDPDTGQKAPQLLRHLRDHHDLLFGVFAAPRVPAVVRVGDPVAVYRRSTATAPAGPLAQQVSGTQSTAS